MDKYQNPFTADVIALARQQGFECYGYSPAEHLHINPEVRSMCAANRCQAYGKNWMCPPACGDLESFAADIAQRTDCVVVQTIANLEDDFDLEGMVEAKTLHLRRFAAFAQKVLELFSLRMNTANPTSVKVEENTSISKKGMRNSGEEDSRSMSNDKVDTEKMLDPARHTLPLPLAAGTCSICPTCSCPDLPCRHPNEAFVSMEAAGLLVSDVCESAGIPYYHGKGTLAYVSCIVV